MPRFKQSARRRAQKRASYARHATERRANQNAANARKKSAEARLRTTEHLPEGYRIVTHLALIDRPHLKWLDRHGNLHTEYELSAEELIRRHERSNHGGKKATAEEASSH